MASTVVIASGVSSAAANSIDDNGQVDIMTENYAEFGKSTDRSPIVPEISIRSYTFRVTEIALGLVAFLAVVVCIVLGSMVSSGAGGGSDSPSASAQIGQNQLCVSPPCLKSASYVVSNLNTSVQPCDNFYRYACGRFKTENPLDPETSSITVYSNMYYHNEEKLKKILESPIIRNQDYSTERKLKHYFSSCTDTYRKERAKGSPLITKVINNIGGWYVLGTFNNNSFDFQNAFRKVSVDFWTAAFYTFRVTTDWYDWSKRVIEVFVFKHIFLSILKKKVKLSILPSLSIVSVGLLWDVDVLVLLHGTFHRKSWY